MKDKMNVLFIAPSETMRPAITKVAESYPDIALTLQIGNEAEGKKLALESYNADFDCIVSRGNTAALIRKAVSIPVVEVKVTLYDVLVSLSGASVIPKLVAAVGYNSVVSGMDALKRFLPFDLEIFGFDHTDELDEIFRNLRSSNIDTIVCDTITYQIASKLGFHAYILSSGNDAFRYAFDQVMQLYQSSRSILEENQLLRRLSAVNSESGTVIYSRERKLYFSSLTEQDAPLLEYLQERLSDFETTDKFKIIKRQAGYQYRISARNVNISGRTYYAYFISRRMPDMQSNHRGIRYVTEEEIRKEMNGSVFRIAGLENYYSTEINQALSRKNPVLIFGEVGVGKNHLAELIYLNSNYTKNPFIFIDCLLLNKQTWTFLISKNDSPLCDNGNTLFLKNIDALDADQLSQLLAALEESEAAKRNRLLISCSARRENSTTPHLQKTMYQLSCLTIHMLPLRGQYGTVERSVQFLLKHLRQEEGLQAKDPDSEAMSMLLHYSWPQNYLQLIRVVRKIAILAGNNAISREIVSDALTTEMYLTQGETDQTANTTLDLTKSLDEINADIVRIILEQKGGNHSLTAKSLGISRTTMWRMLKTAQSPKEDC